MAGSSSLEAPVYSRLPISIERGKGCTVWDTEGRKYLDLYGGHAVAALGYAHSAVTKALSEQVQTLSFQTNAVGNSARDRAIEDLHKLAPMPDARVFLVNSGAEANENALRIAFLNTRRSKIVAVRGAFHGRTAACAAITDHSETWYGFPQRPFEVAWVDSSDCASLESAIDVDTAAFIFEPVQGVAGAVALNNEFIKCAADRCKQTGALLIADEVQSGVGRTGTLWAIERFGVQPDILTAAKGLGNGFPVGAVLASASLADQLKTGWLGTTFGGGPMAGAVISAVLGIVGQESFLQGVRERSARLIDAALQAGVSEVTGRGYLLGLNCGRPAAEVRRELLSRGILTGDAKNPNIVRLLPPLILSEQEIDAFADALKEVLA